MIFDMRHEETAEDSVPNIFGVDIRQTVNAVLDCVKGIDIDDLAFFI